MPKKRSCTDSMQDPFVDDTVIFAGRIREAKRARKEELDALLAQKNPRLPSSLHMSSADALPSSSEAFRLAVLRQERYQLSKETEDDWVSMVLFAEWSHGYMQMNMLMSEVQGVIDDIADWMDEAFVKAQHPASSDALDSNSNSTSMQTKKVRVVSPGTSETETDDPGLSFVPRKYRTPSTSLSEDTHRIQSESSDTLRGSEAHTSKLSTDIDDHNALTTTKGKSTKQTGHIITEEELMNRRRMLDAHIFD